MPTSQIAVSQGSGKNIATHSISEDAVTKELQRVVISDNLGADIKRGGVSLADLLTAVTAAGAGTGIDISGLDFVALNVRGISVAVMTFQASIDGTNWDDVYALTMGTFTLSTTTSGNGNFLVSVAGYRYLRANITSYGSGTITVNARTHVGHGFDLGFMVKMNTPSYEDETNGVARMIKKYMMSATLPPLTSSSLYGDVDILAKDGPGNVFSAWGCNLNATVRYLQFFNQITAPTNPNVPVNGLSFPLAQNEKIILGQDFWLEVGNYFSTGIAWGFSTTAATFTAATTTDHAGNLRYL